jgi:hypothetical protein
MALPVGDLVDGDPSCKSNWAVARSQKQIWGEVQKSSWLRRWMLAMAGGIVAAT